MISRQVRCKNCGYKGVVEAHDTKHLPSKNIFTLLGKDSDGRIHLKCPKCSTDNSYGPTEFINPWIKIILIAVAIFIIYKIIKC